MLITKEVEVELNPNVINHYENLGYKIPRCMNYYKLSVLRGTKIIVKVHDLPKCSEVLVKVECDCKDCITPLLKLIPWVSYLKNVKEGNKYYCQKCASSLYGAKNRINSILKNGDSFEQWCVKNCHQDILDRWDYDKNILKPTEICYGSGKKFWFKCPRNIHESELKGINHLTSGREDSFGCNKCNSFAQWGIDNLGNNFLKEYWNYELNNEININPWNISFGTNKKVWIICQNKQKPYHGSYYTTAAIFTNGSNCPYCSNRNGKVHLLDSLGTLFPQVLEIWSDKNKKTPFEYSPGSAQKVWWKCLDGNHKDYLRIISGSNNCDFRCPECTEERNESFLQEKVRLYLENLGYKVLHEYNCNIVAQNPKSKKGHMPYDNEIPKLKLIIEVHGKQHYKISSWHTGTAKKNHTTPEYEFHMQKVRDRYKRIYAKYNGYSYLEIPYWTENDQNDYKILIDSKIMTIK